MVNNLQQKCYYKIIASFLTHLSIAKNRLYLSLQIFMHNFPSIIKLQFKNNLRIALLFSSTKLLILTVNNVRVRNYHIQMNIYGYVV